MITQTMPRGDISVVQWKQEVAEDFLVNVPLGGWPGPYAASFMTYPLTWLDTEKKGRYNPGIFSVHDSCLDIAMYTDAKTGLAQVGCIVPTLPGLAPKQGQLWQRHAMRFKVDPVTGYKLAWLMWPDDEFWPQNGEIDFPEASLDKTIDMFVHLQGATSGSDQAKYATNIPAAGAWHTAETIWTAGGVKGILDGVVVGNYTGSRVPSTPMHLCIQCETSTDGETRDPKAVAHVLLDWVTVYRKVA